MRRRFSSEHFAFLSSTLFVFAVLLFAGSVSAQETEAVAEEAAGQADLDEATTLKLGASSMADLERVIELTEQAIEKGLEPDSESIAKSLITATLFQHGSRFAQALFDPRERTERPAMLKQFALKDLTEILKYDDTMPQVHMMIARLEAVSIGRPTAKDALAARQRGLKSINRALELLKDDTETKSKALVLRASFERSDSEKRIDFLTQAIDTDSSNADAWRLRGKSRLIRGEMLAAQGKLDDAKGVRQEGVSDFTKLLGDNPEDPDALQSVAELFGRLGDFEKAMQSADQAIEQNPGAFSLYLLRARLNHKQKKYDAAIEDLNEALDIQPGSFLAHLDRSEVYFDKGDKAAAGKDYSKSRSLQGERLPAIILQRMLIRSQNDSDKAIAEVEKFREIDELSAAEDKRDPAPEFRLQLATTYSVLKNPNKAIEVLEPLLAKETSSNQRAQNARFVGLRTRADAYLSIGKHSEAVDDYRDAKKLIPKDDGVLNNLAWVLSTSPDEEVRDGKQAIELATEACEVTEWKEAHILSTLAAAYAESGDFDAAKEYSTQAVNLAENAEQIDTEMVKQLKGELESYEQEKPWRESKEDNSTDESGDSKDEDADSDA